MLIHTGERSINCFALFYFVINACISHVIITLIRYFLIPKSRDFVSHNPVISGLKNGQGLQSLLQRAGLMKWTESFLSNRYMRDMVNGQHSPWSMVVSGVLQDSVLGLLLFLLFVNDVPHWIKTNIRMFADDTKIWTQLSHPVDALQLSCKWIWIS